MRSLELTASGIVRALSTTDEAVRRKAELLAEHLLRQGIETRVERRAEGSYAIVASSEDLFSREFGGLNRQPEGVIEATIRSLQTGGFE